MDTVRKIASVKLGVVPAALVAGFIFTAAPGESQAATCDISTICAQTVRMEHSTTRQRIQQAENAISKTILESLERALGAMREQTGAITASEAQNTQAAGENAQKVQQAADMHRETGRFTPLECGATSGAQGPSGGGTRRSGGGGKAANPLKDTKLSDSTKSAIEHGILGTTLPPENGGHAQSLVGVGGCSDFSDPESAMGLLCKRVGAPAAGTSPFPNADISAATLLDGPQKKDQKIINLSVPAGGEEDGARQAHLNALFSANPVETPPERDLKDVARAAPFLGKYREYLAAKNLAKHGAEVYARLSTIDPETKAALDAIKVEDAAFYDAFFKDVDDKYHANGVSPLTLMNFQVESRIGNEDWMKRMSNAPVEEKATDQLAISAFSLRMQYQQLVAQYQTNVLLGKLIDLQVEQTLRPKLDRAASDMTIATAGRSAPTAAE